MVSNLVLLSERCDESGGGTRLLRSGAEGEQVSKVCLFSEVASETYDGVNIAIRISLNTFQRRHFDGF